MVCPIVSKRARRYDLVDLVLVTACDNTESRSSFYLLSAPAARAISLCAAACAAVRWQPFTVLRSSMAIVIGPTPPGTCNVAEHSRPWFSHGSKIHMRQHSAYEGI
jgi:hypothetical protein